MGIEGQIISVLGDQREPENAPGSRNVFYSRNVGEMEGDDKEISATIEVNGIAVWYRNGESYGIIGFCVGDIKASDREIFFSLVDFLADFKAKSIEQIEALVKMKCFTELFEDEQEVAQSHE